MHILGPTSVEKDAFVRIAEYSNQYYSNTRQGAERALQEAINNNIVTKVGSHYVLYYVHPHTYNMYKFEVVEREIPRFRIKED